MSNTTGFRVDANINPFEASMRRMVDAAKAGQGGVSSSLGNLSQTFVGLKTAILAIPAAITGGLMGSLINSADAMGELSERTGVSVERLAGLQFAAKMGGASADSLAIALRTLSKNISEAGQGNKGLLQTFGQLGVQIKDAEGNLRKADDVLIDLAAVFPKLQDADRVAVSMQLLGKAGSDMVPMLAGGREGLLELIAEGQRLNPVTTEMAQRAGEFNDHVDKISMTIRASLMPVVAELLPELNRMSEAFLVGTKVFGGFWAAIAGAGFVSPFKDTGEQVVSLTKDIEWLEKTVSRYKSFGSDTAAVQEELKLARQRLTYFKELQALEAKRTPQAGGGRGFVNPASVVPDRPDPRIKIPGLAAASTKEQSQMPLYEAELAKKIALFEREAQAQGTLRQFSKVEEAAYWKEVSGRAALSAEDKGRAEKKWRDLERGLRTEAFAVEMADLDQRKQAAESNYAERITLAQQAHTKTVAMYGAESKEAATAMGKVLEEKRKQIQQLQQLEDLSNQRRRDQGLANIEFDRQDAEHKVAMGLMTQEQLLVQQAQFEERMHAIKLQYLQLALAAVDPQKDPVKKAELDAQIEQLELQHQLRLGQIANETTQASTANMRGMLGSIESSWGTSIKGMLSGTMTFAQGVKGMFKGVVDAVISMLAQMVAKWMVQQIMMKVFGKAMGLGTVATEAAKAGAGGVASMAAAPFPLNLSAPAFGAAMSAAAMAFAPVVASASGGFDIPRGMNPLTQLHEQEMVLPAHIANPLRDNLAAGGGAAPAARAPEAQIRAMPPGEWLMLHRGDLVQALRGAQRDFAFVKF